MPTNTDRVNFFFGFSNKTCFLFPWYSSGVAYDKLLPVNDKIPATMYGYPLPVVPVRTILWAIDKIYGTDFSHYCHTVAFGETDMLGLGISKEGTIYDIYNQLLTVGANYSEELQTKIQEIFDNPRLNPIYDLGVIPCVKSKYKVLEHEGEIAHITSATYVQENDGKPNYVRLPEFSSRLFDIHNGLIYPKEPSLKLKIKGNISFTARAKSSGVKDDLTDIKLQVRYFNNIPVAPLDEAPSETLAESEHPISYRHYTSHDPRIVSADDGTDVTVVNKIYFPLTNWVINTETDTEYRQNFKFAFVLNQKEDESFEVPTGFSKTDTKGFWFFPNANRHLKIVSPRMTYQGDVSAEDLCSALSLSLEYDEEKMENISIAQIDITIEPDFDEGGMPHLMCPIYSLPDMTCLDFIRGLIITEGSYLYKDDDNKIRKRQFISLLDNIRSRICYNISALNDSIKFDGSNGLSQRNIFMSEADKDSQQEDDAASSEGYANNLFVCKINNKHINEKQTISTNPFYPPFIKNVDYPELPTGDCVRNWDVSDLLIFRKAQEEVQIGASLSGIVGKPTLWTLKLGDATGYSHVVEHNSKYYRFSNSIYPIKRLELKEIPTFRFKNNPNYKMLKRIIELGIAVKCKCVLPIEDTFNIDWTKPVYIDRLNSYFLLVSVSWSSADNVSELEMLKIPADILVEDNGNE